MSATFWEALDEMLQQRGIYHGVPLGVGAEHITTENPSLQQLLDRAGIQPENDEPPPDEDGSPSDAPDWLIVNEWKTSRAWRGAQVWVTLERHRETGRARVWLAPFIPHALRQQVLLDTGGMRCRYTDLQAELRAQRRLREMISDNQWHAFVLADAFLEHGRSGVIYFLRKNRPTLALGLATDGMYRTLGALCLHPLGYYTGTHAGVMAPSDEVIAHLLHIRGDEHFFWRKANQIPLDSPYSGV
ncbi:MAG: hypothetical protein HY340_02730 [Candidatus Kerfeldbacteria bacterium]|nr:hypothetical protein [Candidatus Kerfeldbacteria bacterium]